MSDPNEIFDSIEYVLQDFPESDYRFSTLQDYIHELTEFLEFTYRQKLQRLKHKISIETDEIKQGEMLGDLSRLEDNGLEYLSHTIWGGLLTSIFASYESSILEVFDFFNKKYNFEKFEKFEKKGRTSFIDRAEQYSLKNFNCTLFQNPNEKRVLQELSLLRNSYVHNGCSLTLLSASIRKKIIDKVYKDYSLGIHNGYWLANPKNTHFYFHHVYNCFTGYQRRITDYLFEVAKARPTL